MSNAIYWAVKLDDESKVKLLDKVKPIHDKVFGEHMTIVFGPNDEQEASLSNIIGEKVIMSAFGVVSDDKGQAVFTTGFDRFDGGVSHITISCANGIKPNYSNELIKAGTKKFSV